MHKTKVEFRTSKGVILAGTILDDKELKKHFSSKEIEDFKNDKYLEEIIIPNIDIKSTVNKSNNETAVIVHIDEMSDEQLQQYAEELGIDITSLEDSDEVYNAITDFDYASLKVGPLKKFAQIVGANIENKTLKDEYLAAIGEVLKLDDDSGEE